ncbi:MULTISPECIES: DedA family protein [Rhizobiaceae]|uniref:Membrane protein DedA with SNARE-associated domain n=1 Tax=Aliirhizobium cellulosilyticum TaxID=393664 RepID=A0A7W6XCV2_9HYPH|nr:DedA family protein [Rhizobium cellulosilyticum]MBB4350499.1 membrane protein DedA with SNARE-associated domain [Rhizobium cellulosilyticum]MBB4413469.1 membrane protein DedA with SNARE-associated domain [Rhizobium cellulosilyticum]MBB4448102.1 membrane protein DedA with SNARE-associated domain [Rhizobium cellulosilyticum]
MPFEHFSLEHLISQYGVLAVFLGAAFEGETAVFLGGVFAHRHFMSWWEAATAAAIGSFAADQAWFFAGRYANRLALVQRFLKTDAAQKVSQLLEAHPTGFILAFRFIYGMRTVSPIAIGLSSVPALRFVILNFIAAVVWAVLITSIGYLFGNAVEMLFGRLKLHLHMLIAIAAIAVILTALAYLIRRQMRGGSVTR